MSLASLLPNIGRSHDGSDKPVTTEPLGAPARMALNRANPDEKRFNEINTRYLRLAQTEGQQNIDLQGEIRTLWSNLASDARNGNQSAQKTMQALWAHRMVDEIIAPKESMLRINYNQFDQLAQQKASGKLSEADFKTEVQWRALHGLYCFYSHDGSNSPLAPSPDRWAKAVNQLLNDNPHEQIQGWGNHLMNYMFNRLSLSDQQEYASSTFKRYWDSTSATQKFEAMERIAGFKTQRSLKDDMSSFKTRLGESIEQAIAKGDKDAFQALTYHVVLSAQLGQPLSDTQLDALLKPDLPDILRQAVVWSLGVNPNASQAERLKLLINDESQSADLREIAVLSLGEFKTIAPTTLDDVLTTYTWQHKTAPWEVKNAAHALRLRASEGELSTPDHYVTRFLKTDTERNTYRNLRNTYIVGWNELTTVQKNLIDRALIPYMDYLPSIINGQGKHHIGPAGESVIDSPQYRHLSGVRTEDGRMYDSISGVSSAQNGAVSPKDSIYRGTNNVFAHEFSHHLHQKVLSDSTIKSLYDSAKSDKRFLDYYSAFNHYEYFAQGGAAMDSAFLDHSRLFHQFFNNGYNEAYGNLRSKLRRMDPHLFRFLESLRKIPLDISRLGPNPFQRFQQPTSEALV